MKVSTLYAVTEDEKLAHQASVGRHWRTVAYIVNELAQLSPDHWGVKEAWDELEQDEQRLLWMAPTKGGCAFSTRERELLRQILGQTKGGSL